MARTKIPPQEATTEEVYNKLALFDHRASFSALASALAVLNQNLPPRSSLRQTDTILEIMAANARGERITLTDIRNKHPDTSANVNKSYQAFLPPTARDPESVGWVELLPDVNDRRKQYLILTEQGRQIALKMAEAMANPSGEIS